MVSTRALTKLLCVVGPTASGKSALALDLAQVLNGEIINADSRQFYRDLNIGTAKPSEKEMALVPHHLVNVAELDETWDVGRFVKAARECIAEVSSRGKLPILVGGTGLYVKHLLYGLAQIPEIPETIRQDLEIRLAEKGLDDLYSELKRLDPQGARRLKAGDTQRILRSLEVILHTGQPLHEFWAGSTVCEYDALQVAVLLDREDLYKRINERVVEMMKNGLKAEAQDLFARHSKNAILKKTIGYAECDKFGFDDLEQVTAEIQKNSRHFAKRQMTWFRQQKNIHWLGGQSHAHLVELALALAKNAF